MAARLMSEKISLRKSLHHASVSPTMWYYSKKGRNVKLNPETTETVRRIGLQRRTYGTRRMSAAVSQKLHRPVNRKQVQRIFKKLGWIEPQKTKKEIIRAEKKILKPTAPNILWEMDMTYIKAGAKWCYCFNVLDVYTREWVGYILNTRADASSAVDSLLEAIHNKNPDLAKLVIRTDNGTQYTSRRFKETISFLHMTQEFIWYNTPEQNGHIESFHKTLKKEYLWPREFETFQEVEEALAEAFADYNRLRIHSALGYVPPAQFANNWEAGNI